MKGLSATCETEGVCTGRHRAALLDPGPVLRHELDHFVNNGGPRDGPGRVTLGRRAGEPVVAFSPIIPHVSGSEITRYIDENQVYIHGLVKLYIHFFSLSTKVCKGQETSTT